MRNRHWGHALVVFRQNSRFNGPRGGNHAAESPVQQRPEKGEQLEMKRMRIRLILATAGTWLIVTGCGQSKTPKVAPQPAFGAEVHKPFGDGGDSPVRVAGGSITVHAFGGWTSVPHTTTSFTATPPLNPQIEIGGFYITQAPYYIIPSLTYWDVDRRRNSVLERERELH